MSARLLRAQRRDRDFELVFGASDEYGWREASVLVSLVGGRPLYSFPHARTAAGASLGTDEADAALVERARQFVAAREAARVWDEFAGKVGR
jgi:hypothetical protein